MPDANSESVTPDPQVNREGRTEEIWICLGCGRIGYDASDLLRQGCEGKPTKYVPASLLAQERERADAAEKYQDAQLDEIERLRPMAERFRQMGNAMLRTGASWSPDHPGESLTKMADERLARAESAEKQRDEAEAEIARIESALEQREEERFQACEELTAALAARDEALERIKTLEREREGDKSAIGQWRRESDRQKGRADEALARVEEVENLRPTRDQYAENASHWYARAEESAARATQAEAALEELLRLMRPEWIPETQKMVRAALQSERSTDG